MEHKYESDLSRREKLQQQWQDICRLKGKKRLEYLWNYYKFVLVIVLAAVLVVHTIGVMLRGARENTVLSIVVVDASQNGAEAAQKLEEALLAALRAEGTYDHVETVLSADSLQTDESIAKLRVSLSMVGEADLVVCGEDVYREYAAQGAFAEITPLLGDEVKAAQACMADGQIELGKCQENILSEYVEYSPAYICILEHSGRKEAAAEVIRKILL